MKLRGEADVVGALGVAARPRASCGSTAWVATLLNMYSWFTGMWPEQAQDDVWAGVPGNRIAGVLTSSATATQVGGRHVATGRWG